VVSSRALRESSILANLTFFTRLTNLFNAGTKNYMRALEAETLARNANNSTTPNCREMAVLKENLPFDIRY
jgi:hypothetical protein